MIHNSILNQQIYLAHVTANVHHEHSFKLNTSCLWNVDRFPGFTTPQAYQHLFWQIFCVCVTSDVPATAGLNLTGNPQASGSLSDLSSALSQKSTGAEPPPTGGGGTARQGRAEQVVWELSGATQQVAKTLLPPLLSLFFLSSLLLSFPLSAVTHRTP